MVKKNDFGKIGKEGKQSSERNEREAVNGKNPSEFNLINSFKGNRKDLFSAVAVQVEFT